MTQESGEVLGREQRQQPDAHGGETDATDAASQREQQILGQELLNQPPAARAGRGPEGELLLPARSGYQQEIGDVRAADEQDKADGADEERQHVFGVAEQRFADRQHQRPELSRRLAAGLHQLPADGRRFGRRGVGRDPRFQAAHCHHPACVGDLPEVGGRPERDVLQAGGQHEPARHHTNDDPRLPVDADRLSNGVRSAAELPPPHAVADDDRPGFLLLHDVVEILEPVGAP